MSAHHPWSRGAQPGGSDASATGATEEVQANRHDQRGRDRTNIGPAPPGSITPRKSQDQQGPHDASQPLPPGGAPSQRSGPRQIYSTRPAASKPASRPVVSQVKTPIQSRRQLENSGPSPSPMPPPLYTPSEPRQNSHRISAAQQPSQGIGTVMEEEPESRKSAESTTSSSGSSAILYADADPKSAKSPVDDLIQHYGGPKGAQHAIKDESRGRSRKASLGQIQKPKLTHIRNSSRTEAQDPPPRETVIGGGTPKTPSGPAPSLPPSAVPHAGLQQDVTSNDRSAIGKTSTADNSSNLSLEPPRIPEKSKLRISRSPATQPAPPHEHEHSTSMLKPAESKFRRLSGIMTNSDKAMLQVQVRSLPSAGSTETLQPSPESTGLSPKDADKRASTTSLAGLIHRALSLASNLERGRTSSKFGVDWMTAGNAIPKRGSSGSLSSIANSSASTSLAENPQEDAAQRPRGTWARLSAPLKGAGQKGAESSMPSTYKTESRRRQRRYCGMPLRIFLTVTLLSILLLVIAVIVPVAVFVLPSRHDDSSSQSPAGASSPDVCHGAIACRNGGVSVLSSAGFCRCICINGWTGRMCTRGDTTDCVMMNSAGVENATIGSALPQLIKNSKDAFGLSLNASSILSLFSAENMSCTSENALITFTGVSPQNDPRRSRLRRAETENPSRAGHRRLVRRSGPPKASHIKVAKTATENAVVTTTNGIVIVNPTSATPSNAVPPASTAASQPSAAPPNFQPKSAQAIEFARTAILYILQSDADLNVAITAQSRFQEFFLATTPPEPTNLQLGFGWQADMTKHTVQCPESQRSSA